LNVERLIEAEFNSIAGDDLIGTFLSAGKGRWIKGQKREDCKDYGRYNKQCGYCVENTTA
jgi:hypothetical protein